MRVKHVNLRASRDGGISAERWESWESLERKALGKQRLWEWGCIGKTGHFRTSREARETWEVIKNLRNLGGAWAGDYGY